MGQASSSDRPARRGSFGGEPPGYLGGYFSVSRLSTIGGTMPATDVPKLATSLMRRDEMYVYRSCGIRNTVSTVDGSLRFMSAIWNSYSKSDTARMPRTMQSARSRATRSINRPSNETIRRCGPTPRFVVASSIISRRCSTVKSGCLDGLATTATMTSSKMARLRWMTSTWPLCSGSNMPGYTARFATRSPSLARGLRRGIVAARSKESQGRLPESPRAKRGQRAGGRGRRALGEMLRDDHRTVCEQRRVAQALERLAHVVALVRRVQEHDVEARGLDAQRVQRAPHGLAQDTDDGRDVERRHVGAQRLHRTRVALDERHVRGAARQRLEPDATGAGEEVEHARLGEPRHQRVEQRDAHLVGGRAGRVAARRGQAAALVRARDDPHVSRRSGCGTRQPTVARSSLPRQRVSSAWRRPRCSACRSSGSSAMIVCASRRASSRIGASRRRSATRNSGKPDCRVPKNSPGPRSCRSTSAILKPSLLSTIASTRRWASSLSRPL